jgi:HlyD family secretion protein
VLIDEGMVVKEGDLVARLDSVLAERDLALARSRADAAEAAIGGIAADLRDAERIWSRNQHLSQRSVVSEADLTKAEAKVGVLRAQLKQSEAQFATTRLEAQRTAEVLEKHRIRAPFTGVVVERSAQPGEMISPMSVGGYTRTGICTLVDMDSIEVEVDVNEAFIGRVKPGIAVSAVLDAYPDWTIPASVIRHCPDGQSRKGHGKGPHQAREKGPAHPSRHGCQGDLRGWRGADREVRCRRLTSQDPHRRQHAVRRRNGSPRRSFEALRQGQGNNRRL